MKNTQKFIAVVGVALLMAVLVVALLFWTFKEITVTAEARKSSFVLVQNANELLAALIDAETSLRGFLLTGDEVFLDAYKVVRDNIRQDMDKLLRLTSSEASRRYLEALVPMIASKMSYFSINLQLGREGNTAAMLENMRGSQGKQLMDAIRAGMAASIQAEQASLFARDEEFKANMRRMFVLIITVSLFALLLVFSFAYFFSRETQHRLKNLIYRKTRNLLHIQEGLNKRLEEAIKALNVSEEHFAVTLESIGDGVLATDMDGRITFINPVAQQFTGWTKAEALGKPVGDVFYIVDRDTRKKFIVPVMETLEHGTARDMGMQTVLVSRIGIEYDIADSCAPICARSGKIVGAVLVFHDITEKTSLDVGMEKKRKGLEEVKKTEDEAREYAESIINTIREPLISLDQDLRVVSVSRSFYEVFKVNPTETVGQLIYDLGNKQWDIPKLRELLETILPQKTTFENYEVEHDFATIGKRIMLLNARQIQRGLGKERIILLAIEDITERREIEAGLEKTRKELEVIKISGDEAREYAESVINTIREPLIGLDQDLRVLTVSRSFYEVFKVKPEETLGQLIYDLGNKQWNIPKLRELLETILPQKATFENYEVEHDFAGIGRRFMLLNARQIDRALGKERIILLAIEDITERREVENGLEKARKELAATKIAEDEAREYAESMIDTVREPLIVLDQDLRVVTASRSFYVVFRVKPEETVGQLIYDLGNKQWNIPQLRELLETILPRKTSFDNYEVEHDFATIGERIMLLNARQIQRVLGKERIILLAIEDITVRREIETGLEHAHEELKQLADKLERSARVKSEFLANMSHELRTPLNSINGFSEVLYDETFGKLNEKQKKYVNNVLTSGKHLLLLINQILDMAKLEAGKMKLTISSIPLKSLLYDISFLVEDLIIKKKLHMSLGIADDLPNIEADELKVKEILYNLLSNAVKFSPEGSKIGMNARKIDSLVEIVVWDTGIGIAPENMAKIFEGFFRVDTPYSRVTEGTGLGLPLSRNLVELHSGELFVESDGLNKGTSVRFTLPIVSKKVV